MNRLARSVAAAATALGLSACLAPEKFEASVRFKPDGGFNYQYEGTVAHVLAASAIKQRGRLTAQEEEGLKREVEMGAPNSPGFKRIVYQGNARYDVRVDEDVKPGGQVDALKIFTVTQDKDKAYTLAVPPIKDKDREQLRALGIKVDGKFEVRKRPANPSCLS